MTETVTNQQREKRERRKRPPERTCVGCGQRDDASKLVRVVLAEEDGASAPATEADRPMVLAFDLAGGAFGRGAHVHPRTDCLARAPRGLARAFRRRPVEASELGRRLVEACDRSMRGLLLSARRLHAVAVGADAAREALVRGAPLAIVAVDAGAVATVREVLAAVAQGRGIAWGTRGDLGGLLGESQVALCAVRHEGIATKLKSLRAAADAGASMIKKGEGCSPSPSSEPSPVEPETCRPEAR